MGKEIERKFLTKGDGYKKNAKGALYRQGYLFTEPGKVVRVRICGDKGFLTVKGNPYGITRLEYEYEIPLNEAEEMLELLCEKPIIEKQRFKYSENGFTWEVDEFFGDNEGLAVAEIELKNEDEEFIKPQWVGEEVSNDPRYANSNLIKRPFKTWGRKY